MGGWGQEQENRQRLKRYGNEPGISGTYQELRCVGKNPGNGFRRKVVSAAP